MCPEVKRLPQDKTSPGTRTPNCTLRYKRLECLVNRRNRTQQGVDWFFYSCKIQYPEAEKELG